MRLIIVRHGETDWTVAGRYTGCTDVSLTADGRRSTVDNKLLRCHRFSNAFCMVSPRCWSPAPGTAPPRPLRSRCPGTACQSNRSRRNMTTATTSQGLTAEQIRQRAPGWDIWRDGCPDGESTTDVGRRADAFLHAYTENGTRPVADVTHGQFSRILAARTLGLAAESGRLFASATAAVSLIEDHHGKRCVGPWNVDATLLAGAAAPTAPPRGPGADPLAPAAGRLA